MSNTMYLVVAAIVIMVTAVVVIAIFLSVVPMATSLTQASSICVTSLEVSCRTFGQNPPNWNVQTIDVTVGTTTTKKSCAQIVNDALGGCSCDPTKKVLTGGCVGGDSTARQPTMTDDFYSSR